MKKMLSIAVVGGFVAVIGGPSFACEWHTAGHSTDKKATVAETQLPDQSTDAEGMSTFDPSILEQSEEKAE
jgi:hypothetical protein